MVLIVSRFDQDNVAFASVGYGDCRTTEIGSREMHARLGQRAAAAKS
ncbi:hypothetical protein ACVIGA_000218 [Bradyrhizobium sp. USDA 3240]